MREIKFRAYDTQEKEMIDDWIVFVYKKTTNFAPFVPNFWRDDRFVKMQYTGLKDKNGEEIYEGDIVKAIQIDDYYSTDKPKTIITPITISFKTEVSDCLLGGPDGKTSFLDIEVIGNIYENPELLEVVGEGR